MKRNQTRRLILILALTILSALPMPGGAEEADKAERHESGNFMYTLQNDTATIVAYTGKGQSTVIIPEELDGHPVRAVGSGIFTNESETERYTFHAKDGSSVGIDKPKMIHPEVTAIELPAGLLSIAPDALWQTNVRDISVAPGSESFSVMDGVLFDKTGETLLHYPAGRGEDAYTVPEGARAIADYAFCMRDMGEVILPEGVESVGAYAFAYCESLRAVTLPEGLKSLGEMAFFVCGALREVVIPEGIEVLPAGVFSDCYAMRSVTLPESLRAIEGGAFFGCYALTTIHIPAGVTEIHPTALGRLSGLAEITVAEENPAYASRDGVLFDTRTNALHTFPPRKRVVAYTVPEGTAALGSGAFHGCGNLTAVSLPASVTEIGSRAFYSCANLESIALPEGITSVPHMAFGFCGKLAEVILPDSVTEIEPYAFEFCRALTAIELPEGVHTIGKRAFRQSGLVSVTLPEAVTSIGEIAFENCAGLTDAHIPPAAADIDPTAFDGCTKLTIHGAEGSAAQAYAEAKGIPFEAK